MKLTEISVTTDGLYAWGRGFMTADQAAGWDRFWRGYARIFWRVSVDELGSVFLSTTYGGGMIHPMDFDLVLRDELPRSVGALNELDAALRDLAKELKFTYQIRVRELAADDASGFALFSTEDGVEDAPPGRIGVPKDEPCPGRSRKAEKPEPITCGKGPYRAEIVPSKGGSALWVSPRTYASEKQAQQAILRKAKTMKHVLSGYTRHWVTDKHEHIIDYGSHSLYGRITSIEDKIREAAKEETT